MSSQDQPQEQSQPAAIDTERNVLEGFYLESPTEEVVIETDFLKLVQLRTGQVMAYWGAGKLRCIKEEGIRMIFSPFELWGSGMVINTARPRNERIEVKTAQTADNIDVVSATASLYYKIKYPGQLVKASYNSQERRLEYRELLVHRAEADLRQFILSKTLKDLREAAKKAVGEGKIIDTLSQDTRDYFETELGIEAQASVYRRIDLPSELESRLAEAVIATEEAEGRIKLAEKEVQIAELYAKAAEHYRGNPEALELRRLQSLDNLVETQRSNPNMFIGIDPLLGLIGRAARQQ